MKIQLFSDIHFEWFLNDKGKFFLDQVDPTGVDVLVLAGDIISARSPKALIELACKYPNVVFVAGNHCFYGSGVGATLKNLREAERLIREKGTNFHYLDKQAVEINGKRFLGATLWFKEDTVRRSGVHEAWLNDFFQIRGYKPWVYQEHEKDAAWLYQNVKEGDIVVTHHLPSMECVSPRWRTSNYNCFFASSQDNTIAQKKPAFWFFGHTHDSRDVMVHSTRCIANPYGYHNMESNQNFDFNLKIDL